MSKHPDIEIYVKNVSIEQITAWLNDRFDAVQVSSKKGLLHHFSAEYQGHSFRYMIHEKAIGKSWSSIWFQSDETPWKIDLDCAKEASLALNTQVRCIASGWQEGDDPDEWWKVEKDHAEKIQWVTG